MLIRRDEQNIDKAFRQNLHDAEEKAPLHLWDGIRVKTSRQRRPIFWWIVSAAAVFVAGFCTILLFESNQPNQQKGNTAAAYSNESTLQSLAELEREKPPLPNDGNQISAQNEKINGELTSDETTDHFHHRISNTKYRNFDTGKDSRRRPTDKADFNPEELEAKLPNAESTEQIQSVQQKSIDELSEASFAILPPNIDDSNDDIKSMSNSETLIESEILDDASLPIYFDPEHKPLNLVGRLNVGAYYSISNPMRVACSGGDAAELKRLTDRTEIGRGSGYGIAAGYSVYKGLYLSLGIETSSFKENHTWYDTTRVQNVSMIQNQVATYPDGDSTPVYVSIVDTVQHLDILVSKTSHVNTYSSVNVPLMIGFHLPVYHRISLYAETGPVFRFERKQIGSFVFTNGFHPPSEASLAVADIMQSNVEYVYLNNYYSNWKTDWHVGASASIALVKGWSINAGAQCRWMMNRADEIKSLSHRIVQPGVRLGVSCRF